MAMTDREQSAAIDDLELVAKLLQPGSTTDDRRTALVLAKSVSLGPSIPQSQPEPRSDAPLPAQELGDGPAPLRSAEPCRRS